VVRGSAAGSGRGSRAGRGPTPGAIARVLHAGADLLAPRVAASADAVLELRRLEAVLDIDTRRASAVSGEAALTQAVEQRRPSFLHAGTQAGATFRPANGALIGQGEAGKEEQGGRESGENGFLRQAVILGSDAQ